MPTAALYARYSSDLQNLHPSRSIAVYRQSLAEGLTDEMHIGLRGAMNAPGAIAQILNHEAVPEPAERFWGVTIIRGHKVRGTGMLNNELYHGVPIWNPPRCVKDPRTEKRQARMNPEADWVRKEVPGLRVVDELLWQAVKARQAAQESAHANLRDGVRKAREMRLLAPAVVPSNFYGLLI